MKRPTIHAIVPAVEYDDILAITLPYTCRAFDTVSVVTSMAYYGVRELCDRVAGNERVWVMASPWFYTNDAPFNRGAAINDAIERRDPGFNDWVVVLDADVIVPADFRLLIDDKSIIYGARRRMLTDPTKFALYADPAKWPTLELMPDAEPYGYFQLFNVRECRRLSPDGTMYPCGWKSAAGSDDEFMRRWPADKRRWLPNEVLHLGQPGINWCGRVSRFVDGTLPDKSIERSAQLAEMLKLRNRDSNFSHERTGPPDVL